MPGPTGGTERCRDLSVGRKRDLKDGSLGDPLGTHGVTPGTYIGLKLSALAPREQRSTALTVECGLGRTMENP